MYKGAAKFENRLVETRLPRRIYIDTVELLLTLYELAST